MDKTIVRVGAIVGHALINIVIVSYLTNYDITGRWLAVIVFISILFVLMTLFIRHIVSFINFLKTKTK